LHFDTGGNRGLAGLQRGGGGCRHFSLGYQIATEAAGAKKNAKTASPDSKNVQLEIENSEVVTNQLGRDQRIVVTKGGITITFSRDARGKASLCVTGEGQSNEELKAMGQELSQAVVQQYVYQKLMGEMRTRGFNVIEEETNADRSIRLKVRHWDN
jgi:hypothetical protein